MSVYEIVDKYIGIEYVDGGRDPAISLDCWGLIICVIKDIFDILIPDLDHKKFGLLKQYVKGISVSDVKDAVIQNYDLSNWVDPVEDQPRLGDIMLICPLKNLAIHAGVYLNSGKFIHTISDRGVVVSEVLRWKDQIEGYYRLKNERLNKAT